MKAAICKVDEIPDQGAKVVEFFGREVLVLKVEGRPRAIMNTCMHLGGPLSRDGDKLVCAWHGAEFSAATGERMQGPARPNSRLMFLPTRIESDVLTYVYGE